MDWLSERSQGPQSRSQVVGMWQVLVDEGILVHGRKPSTKSVAAIRWATSHVSDKLTLRLLCVVCE